ncbi:hypothetical protein JW851_04005 [Candidatus Woesearchaeota archaeon]|nr:hypothetical protein [Candidatus Woesearchaeota archaeon]
MVDKKKMKLDLEREVEEIPEGVYIPDPNIKSWDKMTWEGVKEEYYKLVPRALRKYEGTQQGYLGNSKFFTKDLLDNIEKECIDVLDNIVQSLKEGSTKDPEPINCNWYTLTEDFKIFKKIEGRLKENKLMKAKLGAATDSESFNIAMTVSNEYRNVISDRNEITVFPLENFEY